MHRLRRRPGLAVEARGVDVADLVLRAVAIDQQRTVDSGRGIGLAAIADIDIDLRRGAGRHVRVEHRCAQGHRTARGAVSIVPVVVPTLMIRATAGVASIEPGDAEAAIVLRPHRHEAVLGRGRVVMCLARRAPVHAVVERTHQHHVVGVGRIGGFLQPVRPQRTVRRGGDVRRVGPVHEHRIADGDRARGLPAAIGQMLGELERRAPAGHLADPAQQQAAIRREAQVRRRGAGHRRQRPGLDGEIADEHGFRDFDLRGAAGKEGEGEGGQGAGDGDHARRVRHHWPRRATVRATHQRSAPAAAGKPEAVRGSVWKDAGLR